MPNYFKAFYRFLISRDLAIILLIIFTLITTANMLGWQNIAPVKKNQSLFTGILTYSFYISGFLLSVNLLACSLQRIWQELRGQKNWGTLKENYILEAHNDQVLKIAQKTIENKGYKKVKSQGSTAHYRKGYGGRWGSIAYHASLLIVVVGIFSLNQTHYEGTLFLTEGQSWSSGSQLAIVGESEQELTPEIPFQITLNKFKINYQGDSAVEGAALVKVEEKGKGSRNEQIKINYPLEVQNIKFMLQNFDYAPRFVLVDDQGQAFFDSYVNLFLNEGKTDFFQIPNSPFSLAVRFYPDAQFQKGKPVNLSLNPVNPLFWVQLKGGEEILGEQYLRLNQEWQTPIGILKAADLSRFVQLMVTQEEGANLLLGGFALTFLGLMLRFLIVEKKLILEIVDNKGLKISGQAEYYQNIFKEEFANLVQQIEKEVGSPV